MAEPIPLIAILGPTAAGKTSVAARLAASIQGEVISADSRQVYRGMDIGTGKDLDDYRVDGDAVPYHLIDIVDPGYEYNVFEYKRDCIAAIREIDARSRRPVLCGGTGMYLSAVLQDYQLLGVPPDPARHAELESMTTAELIRALERHRTPHNTTDTSDRERLIRAVEIAEAPPDARVDSIALRKTVFGLRANVLRYVMNTDSAKVLPKMRLHALETLAIWAKPPVLDRVEGRRRELGTRDPKQVAATIQEIGLAPLLSDPNPGNRRKGPRPGGWSQNRT